MFDLYNRMQDNFIDTWVKEASDDMLDIAATADESGDRVSIAVVNKDPDRMKQVSFEMNRAYRDVQLHTVNGPDVNSCNTSERSEVLLRTGAIEVAPGQTTVAAVLEPHSVNVITMQRDL